MLLTLSSAGCLLLGVWLWKSSLNFRIDAAPIGGMMMLASVLLWIASVFLLGVQVGTMVQQS